MKLTNFLCVGALSALVLTSCVNNDDKSEWNDGSQPVSFTSSIQGVNSRAANNKWAAGDKVGIFMKAAGGELSSTTAINKLYTTDANGILTAFNAENALYYPTDGSSVDFIAYYPFNASLTENTYKVNVASQTDQSAIDLLYSNNATDFAKGTTSKPQLQFTHKLSQIAFNITKDATIPSLTGLKVTFKGMNTTADFTLANGALTNTETVADIVALVNDQTATAIVLPATALNNVKVVFELNGKTFTADYPQASLAEGSKYTHNVKLSDNNGQPVIEMEAATITDWVTVPGGDIDVDFGGGGDTPAEEVVLLDEPFDTNQGAFTINDVLLPDGGTFVWTFSSATSPNPYHYMKASAFIGGSAKASESQLISPELDLSNVTSATLTFMHIVNHAKGTASENQLVSVKEVGTTTWAPLTTVTYPTTDSWTPISSGNIDLTSYAGKKIQIAFIYKSTTTIAATWEVYDVKVVGKTTGGGGEIDPPTPGGQEQTIFEETFGTKDVSSTKIKINAYDAYDNQGTLTFFDRFAAEYQNGDIRSTSTFNNHVWFPASTTSTDKSAALKISGFSTTGYTNLKLSYKTIGNNPVDQNVLKVLCNDVAVTVPSVQIPDSKTYVTVTLNIPNNTSIIEFVSDTDNKVGMRLDDVKLVGTK